MRWIKLNAVSLATLAGVLLSYVVVYAALPNRITAIETDMEKISVRLILLEKMDAVNVADHESIKDMLNRIDIKVDKIIDSHIQNIIRK